MKVIFYNGLPFFLAHGGTQTLLESLMDGLRENGVEVEPARWWDADQQGDILHYMNRPSTTHVRLAKEKGFKVVMTENIDQTASRGRLALLMRRMGFLVDRRTFGVLNQRLHLEVYQTLDAAVYVVELERQVAHYLYGADLSRCHVIPHGLDEDALEDLARPQEEGDYLISAATIIPRKNTVLLARAARQARVPVVFLGKPFSQDDPYFLEFKELVDGRFVRYPGFVSREEKHRLLRGARGFALLSQFESGCIALYEGAAAGLPLFLPDLPWASRVYQHASSRVFVKLSGVDRVASQLRQFYEGAHRQGEKTFPIMSWREVAAKYLELYQTLLGK